MNESPPHLDFVAIGIGAAAKTCLGNLVDVSKVKLIDKIEDFDAFIEDFELDKNTTIFVGGGIVELSANELGQTLRASFINAHIVFLATEAKDFSVSDLKKNGFSHALLFPIDAAFFEEMVLAAAHGGARRHFKAIKMVDIDPGEPLDFSVYFYMPANKKYGLLTANGSISEKKYEKLKGRSEVTVFVEFDQAEKFYDYSAAKLAKLSDPNSGNGSATERSERLRQNVQALFHNIFDLKAEADYESGRHLMEQSHKVVQKFVENKTKINLKSQIDSIWAGAGDSYSHAQSVSSLACLLSMAIDVGIPEELAIAGLFHDIGVTGFPVEPNPLNMDRLSEEERARYSTHPTSAVNMLKAKKFVLTPSVTEIIEKHHERVDGKGFPEELPAHKIPMSAQLLAFSDWFEILMRPEAGQPRPTPLEATLQVQARAGLSNELILKIKSFFLSLDEKKEA